MASESGPRRLLVLSDGERIRGYVHPVRMAILQHLAAERLTVTAVARRLEVHPANLTHHFKRLERLGLIRLVEKRDTGRNLEKLYRAAARSFVVRPRARTPRGKTALVLSILRDSLQMAIDSPAAAASPAIGLLVNVRLRGGDVDRFAKRIRALAAEFGRADHEQGRAYELNVSLYPAQPGATPSERARVEIE